MIREKIRSIVVDPRTAETLCPKDHPFGSKRPCLDTNYFQTYNLPHVRLVDLRKDPIASITETGIDTASESFEFDAIVYATGFDAMTGPIVAVDITGRDGLSLREKWADGPSTYLGLTTVGFPNFFTDHRAGKPLGALEHDGLDRAARRLGRRLPRAPPCSRGWRRSSPPRWPRPAGTSTSTTAPPSPCTRRANSWYMGANVPGKPRAFLPYVAGVDTYRAACDEVVDRGYLGFRLSGERRLGVQRRRRPSAAGRRRHDAPGHGGAAAASAGADVGRGRPGLHAGRRVRPSSGPRRGRGRRGSAPRCRRTAGLPAVPPGRRRARTRSMAYFHGGGWVLGSLDSDDPLCRDLCLRSDAVIVSVDYRHAPESRFPAAADDAFAAVQWIAEHAEDLGGIPGQLVVAGWSAGANIAAVACQLALATPAVPTSPGRCC